MQSLAQQGFPKSQLSQAQKRNFDDIVRSRASLMADEFDGIDARSEILRIVSQVSHISDENGLRRGEAPANKTLRRKKVVHATLLAEAAMKAG